MILSDSFSSEIVKVQSECAKQFEASSIPKANQKSFGKIFAMYTLSTLLHIFWFDKRKLSFSKRAKKNFVKVIKSFDFHSALFEEMVRVITT